MKRQLGIIDVFFPVPAALIVGGTMEEADVATIAWIGMLSSTPPIIGVSFDRRRYTLELIRKTREFTVNIPSADHYKETDFCGLISGRDINKFIQAGLSPIAASTINTPIIKECPFNLECMVVQELQLGDYLLIMGEIVETHIDEDKVIFENNRPQIDISKTKPLVYCATVREYWSLGKKMGNAFQSGMDLLNQ